MSTGTESQLDTIVDRMGLKTLDAVRGTFEAYEIAPSYDEFVEQVEAAEVRA